MKESKAILHISPELWTSGVIGLLTPRAESVYFALFTKSALRFTTNAYKNPKTTLQARYDAERVTFATFDDDEEGERWTRLCGETFQEVVRELEEKGWIRVESDPDFDGMIYRLTNESGELFSHLLANVSGVRGLE